MIIIAGCGFLGERIADLLHDAGHAIVALAHSEESIRRLSQVKPWRLAACDIGDAASVAALASKLGGESVTAIVHCASSNRGGLGAYRRVYSDGMANLLAAFPDAFIVFASSTSVYSQTDGSVVDESSPAEPSRDTGKVLRQVEEQVLARHGAVARLAGLYGPGRSFMLRNLLEGKAVIEGAGGQGRILNQVHRDDAAAAIVRLLLQRSAGFFNVADSQPMTQRECYEALSARFGVAMPSVAPPDLDRKRSWTNKRVSNARLLATGWSPKFTSYLDALDNDPDLVPSILAQIARENPEVLPRKMNVILIGLMGSGKTTVGRLIAQKLGFQFIDTDQLITKAAGASIPRIFETEGEAGFRLHESAVLRSLMNREHCVVATGGGIATQERNHPVLRHLGLIVWLEAEVAALHRRTAGAHDRPLLQQKNPKEKLRELLRARQPLYAALADLRIPTDNLSPEEAAYGIAESVRLHFANRSSAPRRAVS